MICRNLKYIFVAVWMYLVIMASAIPVHAQNKLPVLQAIGKVTLKSGETTEGLIALGYTYDNQRYHANAFYYETPLQKRFILIDLDFTGYYATLLEPPGSGKLFFAESKSDQRQRSHKTSNEGNNTLLNKKTLREENYTLKEEFSLYPELPLSLNVKARITANDNVVTFKVTDIEHLELIRKPSGEWLKKITQAKARLTKKMEADKKKGNLWLNYQEPVWYHDIINDNLELTKWRQYFE